MNRSLSVSSSLVESVYAAQHPKMMVYFETRWICGAWCCSYLLHHHVALLQEGRSTVHDPSFVTPTRQITRC